MSTQSLALALLSLIGIAVAMPASALAKPSDGGRSNNLPDVQFCKDLAAEGFLPWLSVGECIALNNSTEREKQNFWVHRCDNWRDEGLLDEFYNSFSECVHDFRPE